MTKSIDTWLNEYGESHQNKINKLIHWVCVPGIFVTVVGLLWAIPVPEVVAIHPLVNWASFTLALVSLFYLRLSPPIAVGIILFSLACMAVVSWYEQANYYGLVESCAVTFVVLWVFQFIGHKIEGKKPSFFQDIQFLLIGPAWLMGFTYRKMGLRY